MRKNKPLKKARIIDDLSEQVGFNRKKSLKLRINE
jgi:hypothetical protein